MDYSLYMQQYTYVSRSLFMDPMVYGMYTQQIAPKLRFMDYNTIAMNQDYIFMDYSLYTQQYTLVSRSLFMDPMVYGVYTQQNVPKITFYGLQCSNSSSSIPRLHFHGLWRVHAAACSVYMFIVYM